MALTAQQRRSIAVIAMDMYRELIANGVKIEAARRAARRYIRERKLGL